MRHARNTDPITSHMAAAAVVHSDQIAAQRIQMYELVSEYQGRTSMELAELCEFDRYQLARRLPELREKGRVESRGMRKCRITGREAMTWWAA